MQRSIFPYAENYIGDRVRSTHKRGTMEKVVNSIATILKKDKSLLRLHFIELQCACVI